MALLSNVPFTLEFHDELSSALIAPKKNSSIKFYSEIIDFFDDPSFELVENKKITVTFWSDDPTSCLYMFGLESLLSDRVEIDENGDSFVRPSKEPLMLYETDYYPLIPGDYLIKIYCNGEYYYAPFRVLPKQMTSEQLTIMKLELEEMLRGITHDFVKQVNSNIGDSIKVIPPALYKQFMIIKKNYHKVMSALSDLYNKANYRIRKEYVWLTEDKARIVDRLTIKSSQTFSSNREIIRVPRLTIDYNLPENQWVKFIIRNVRKILDQYDSMVDEYIKKVQNDIEAIEEYLSSSNDQLIIEKREKKKLLLFLIETKNEIKKISMGFQFISKAHWYNMVKTKSINQVPQVLVSDSRYRALYNLHRDIKNDYIETMIDPMFRFHWKRTDKLYELWGFITILKILRTHFDFSPISGWIFDQNDFDDQLTIPDLPSNEKIVLIKDDWKLNLVYDGSLPLSSTSTSLNEKPLYLGKFNRPDGRIDFYNKDIYLGTLIFEFKYRPIANFWKKQLLDSPRRTREMEQIIAYRRDSNSKFLFGEKAGKKYRELFSSRPVKESWAIYAEANEERKEIHYLPDDAIRLIPLNPGDSHDQIINILDSLFDYYKKIASIIEV